MKIRNKKINKRIVGVLMTMTMIVLSIGGCAPKEPVKQNVTPTVKTEEKTTTKGEVLKVHYIDVGQADSILIQQGNKNMLIDAGNNGDSEVILKYLKEQGVKKLDVVVGTHPHEDHIGSLDKVIESVDIGQIIMPKATSTTKTFQDVLAAVKNKGLKITTPVPGNTFTIGTAECTILAPNSATYKDLNNYSVIIKLKFGQNTFMFDGDAEDVSEKEVLAKGYDVKADVLKLGHHGSHSSTSQEFLDKVDPTYAIVSAGKGNDYGHPHKEVMDRLEKKKIKMYRTDQGGTVVATSDGKNISFNGKPGNYANGGEIKKETE